MVSAEYEDDISMTDDFTNGTNGSSANILEVPLEADGELVTIDLDNDLPENPSEICVLLENEKCAPEYWLAIGTAYARNGQTENAIEVVTKGLEASIVQKDSDKIPFYSCLSWLYLRQLRLAPTVIRDAETGGSNSGSSNGSNGTGGSSDGNNNSNNNNNNSTTKFTKADYHRLATEASNRAYQLDRSWSVNILARGALTSAIGQFDDALSPFQTVLTQSGNANLFALLGRARILYQKKNYKGALQLYQNVLLGRPTLIKPDPRIGIGLCFWKLDDKSGALEAWERAHELQPSSPAVNTLLGLYYMNEALNNIEADNFGSLYSKALQYVQTAYKSNPNYSAASLVLASYLFSKKSQNIDSVLKLLINKVTCYTDLPSLLSDGYFWMGRAYHFLEDYDKALEYYQLAESKNPKSVLPSIGKGLVQMTQESTEAEALLTFENIVSNNPKSLEALLLLGLLNAKRATTAGGAGGNTINIDIKRTQRAVTLLERYLLLAKELKEPPASEALLILSQLYESNNVEKSLTVLKQVAEIQGAQPGEPLDSPHLNNNLGVLYYLNGNYDIARKYFDGALTAITATGEDTGGAIIIPTLTYNIARLDDATGDPDNARIGYNKVLELAPDYLDARIRLTYLSVALNDDKTADSDITKLMEDHDDNLEVRALYGWYLRRRKRSAAKNLSEDVEQKHFKHSLVDCDKHDSYSLVAMGNLYLSVAREIRVNKNSDLEKKEKTYFRAAEFFDKALQIDPQNAFAAQGVAIIFAESRKPELALHIFSKIRETLNDISIYVNSGHCLVELRQFSKAIEAYEYALNRFKNGNDPQLMTLLGRAWYVRGMTEKNFEALKTSLHYSRLALEQAPENPGLMFNVAFIQFQLADYIRRAPESSRTISDIEEAAKGLEEAVISLDAISKVKYPPFPASELEQRSLMGQNTLRKQLERALAEQHEYDKTVSVKLEEARKKQQIEKEKQEEEQQRKAAAEAERQKALADERKKLKEEAEQWTEAARLEAEALKVNEDEDDDDAQDSKNNSSEPSSKKSRKKALSSNGKRSKEKRPKKPKEKAVKATTSRKKFKSEDFIRDSDSDSESELNDDELLSEGSMPGDSDGDEANDDRKRQSSETDEQSSKSSPKKRKLIKRVVADDSENEETPVGDVNDLFGDDE